MQRHYDVMCLPGTYSEWVHLISLSIFLMGINAKRKEIAPVLIISLKGTPFQKGFFLAKAVNRNSQVEKHGRNLEMHINKDIPVMSVVLYFV